MFEIPSLALMISKRTQASLFLVLAVFFWAGNIICGSYLHASIPPSGLAFWRWITPVLFLTLINIRRLPNFFKMMKRYFFQFCLLSLFGVVLSSTLQYVGLDYASAIDAGIIVTLMPIFIALCAELILKERTSKLQKFGMFIAFLGAIILITQGSIVSVMHLHLNFGDLILVFAAFCWGIYSSLLKKFNLPCSSWDLVQATSIISLVVIFIVLISHGQTGINATFKHLDTSTVLVLLYMGFGASLMSYWAWNRGVELIGPSQAGTFLYLMPVFSAILAYIFLDEKLHLYHLAGTLVIFLGVFLTLRKK